MTFALDGEEKGGGWGQSIILEREYLHGRKRNLGLLILNRDAQQKRRGI